MACILFADDELSIRDMLARHLKMAGHTCYTAKDGAEARAILAQHEIDIALLDIMMPGEDGFQLAPVFLEKNIPVLFLTARTAVSDRVYGLRLGADDYILKPFEPAELLARIDVILRRTKKNIYKDAILTIDYNAQTVLLHDQLITLTAMEYALLVQLVQNEGCVFSREKLLAQVWGWDYMGETRTVDVHIQRIRAKMGADIIETVYKRGYRYTRRTSK